MLLPAVLVVKFVRQSYHSTMPNDLAGTAKSAAEMLAHLGRLAYGDGFVCGLTPAQWTALRYFARANRFSRTVSAFADYHATTRGTASQTVKSLVSAGFLQRTRSQSDRRRFRFDLTEKGEALNRSDPFEDLVSAVAELPRGLQKKLLDALERVMGRMVCERRNRPFGTCPLCAHLSTCVYLEKGEKDYFCRFENESIEQVELEQICINYEPRPGSGMQRAFARVT
jgi:DNA-binding MarR family transcriptional regulator